MRPTVPLRTILACLVLSLLLWLPCLAQTYPGSGTQFTNGQNGTPNLPSSNSCTIDQTHFAGEAAGTAAAAQYEYVRTSDFLQRLSIVGPSLDPQSKQYENTPETRQKAVDLINAEYLATLQDLSLQNLKTSSLYVGSEVRTGSGRPVYVLPTLSYSNDKYGIELGSESFYEFGKANDPGRDSVGLSLKVELTDLSRGLARALAVVKNTQKQIDNATI